MRCKKHQSDSSSGVGVCASCLREKLFAVILAQAQAQAEARIQNRVEGGRKSDTSQPAAPGLLFPRSVSPYISRRKSDISNWNHATSQASRRSWADQRFFSTPQVGAHGRVIDGGDYDNIQKNMKNLRKKKKSYGLNLLNNLFGSKLGKPESYSDPRVSNSEDPNAGATSSSWFSAIFSGRRKKQSRTFSVNEDASIGGRRVSSQIRDRGMSPARCSDDEDDGHCRGGSSGYSSESSQGWKQTPRRTPASTSSRKAAGKSSRNRNVSGMTFCLSPLVRPSPNWQWNQKGMPPEMVYSGEIRVSSKSVATSFCKSRSRKLADFGRFNHHH
ncbi:unnamed protein product [Cuscuta campestris]|uniref:DUF740 domain-containing protein n=1 Tax=Cuscuta campestris TaxID=132261 RepID=A0A484LHK4_9ASTE|nr:unnamed protein product [Cuscuta campestris]